MKKSGILLMILAFSCGLFAQNFTVKGVVKDQKTLNAVPFCNIIIVKDTNNLADNLSGTTSLENGGFSLKTKTQQAYLVISSVGFDRKIMHLSQANIQNDILDLGDILLNNTSAELLEVSVTEKQKHFEMHNDKMVMNVDDAISNSTSNAFEMLRKVPGVVIDKDEKLSLNGRSGVLFQFDGRDIRIPYDAMKSILKGMSPSDIEKIEIINNPSSKYEAEGTAGIINIVMAKQQKFGWSGDAHLWTGINEHFMHNEGINLNYVDNNWTITSSLGYNSFAGKTELESDTYIWYLNDTILQRKYLEEYPFVDNSFNANLSADYKINDKSSLGAMITYNNSMVPNPEGPFYITGFMKSPYNVVDSCFTEDPYNEMKTHNISTSVYYNKKIDTIGGQFSLTFDYTNNRSNNLADYISNYYLGNYANGNLMRTSKTADTTINKYNTYSLKLDFIKPLNDRMSLEFGAKSRLTTVDNDYLTYNDTIFDANRSNHLQYTENVNAAYISFSDRINDKLSICLGLRGEHTYTKVNLIDSIEYTNNYFDIFPNVNLSYKINDLDNISLTYAYRITRPDYGVLNPFKQKINDYSYSMGNPNLNSQYAHSLNLNYAFHYFIFLTASYSYTTDLISETYFVDPSTLSYTQMPYNLGYSQQASLGLSSAVPIAKGVLWTIWMQGVYGKTKVDDAKLNIDVENLGFMTWQSLSIDFFWKTKLSISAFYMTGGNEGLVEWGSEYNFSGDISKEFLQKRLKASIGVANIPKHPMNIKMHSSNMYSEMTDTWQYPMLTFSLKYNFGKKADNAMLQKIDSEDMDARSSGANSQGGQSKMK